MWGQVYCVAQQSIKVHRATQITDRLSKSSSYSPWQLLRLSFNRAVFPSCFDCKTRRCRVSTIFPKDTILGGEISTSLRFFLLLSQHFPFLNRASSCSLWCSPSVPLHQTQAFELCHPSQAPQVPPVTSGQGTLSGFHHPSGLVPAVASLPSAMPRAGRSACPVGPLHPPPAALDTGDVHTTESQNHRLGEAGRDHGGSSAPTSLLEQGHSRACNTGLHPDGSGVSPLREISHPFCSSAWSLVKFFLIFSVRLASFPIAWHHHPLGTILLAPPFRFPLNVLF